MRSDDLLFRTHANTCGCPEQFVSAVPASRGYQLTQTRSNSYNSTLPPCSGTMVSPGTTSCDEFAAQNSMSTAEMLQINGLAGGCANWPGNLTSICVQDICNPYTVGQNDTCPSIASANNITITQFTTWNPAIDPLCLNLYQQIGHVVCVSDPTGYVPPTATIDGQPTLGPTAVAPMPTDADPESNTRCGRWYDVNAGDYCALVCNKQAITLQDFYFLNPDINSNCTNLQASKYGRTSWTRTRLTPLFRRFVLCRTSRRYQHLSGIRR